MWLLQGNSQLLLYPTSSSLTQLWAYHSPLITNHPTITSLWKLASSHSIMLLCFYFSKMENRGMTLDQYHSFSTLIKTSFSVIYKTVIAVSSFYPKGEEGRVVMVEWHWLSRTSFLLQEQTMWGEEGEKARSIQHFAKSEFFVISSNSNTGKKTQYSDSGLSGCYKCF